MITPAAKNVPSDDIAIVAQNAEVALCIQETP